MEEEDAYLTGETDPFTMDSSEEAMVVWPAEERDERGDLPVRGERESAEGFKEDRPAFTEDRVGVPASVTMVEPRGVLYGRLELYMLYGDFGTAEAGLGAEDLSGKEPLGAE